MFRTFRSRLFLSYVFIIVVCLLVAAVTLLFLWQVVQNRLTYIRLTDMAQPTAFRVRSLLEGDRPPEQAFRQMQEQADQQEVRILLLRKDGHILADTGGDLVGRRLPLSAPPQDRRRTTQGRYRVSDQEVLLYVALPLPPPREAPSSGEPLLFVALGTPPQRSSQMVREITRRLLLAGGVALLLSIAVSILVSRSITRPLEQAVQATEAIAQGQYDVPLPVAGPEEVCRLADGFNRMAQEVQASRQAQRDFVANVSHELKTPLTSIQGFAQAIVEGATADPEAQKRAAHIIYEESTRMNRLVGDLLELARMDAGQLDLVQAPVDVGALVRSMAERMQLRAAEAGVELHVEVDGTSRVLADGDRLAQVLGNLLDNAIKHTPSGGEVRILAREAEAGPEGRQVEISVTDTGPGIPPEDLARIFERFYQVDKSRSQARAGSGLGLAIARELVEAMGGTIRVESVQGLGSRFTVVLAALEPS